MGTYFSICLVSTLYTKQKECFNIYRYTHEEFTHQPVVSQRGICLVVDYSASEAVVLRPTDAESPV